MSIILSIGKPIWALKIERVGGSFRVATLFFSLIILNYDFDSYLGHLLKVKRKWEQSK